MHKYKEVGKRILVLILTVCLAATMLPEMPVYAESSIQNTTITLYKDNTYTTPVTSTTYTYTGSAITPYVQVKDGSTVLTEGTDYKITYQNNINAGTATVVISGRGSYSGETSTTFVIQKVKISYIEVTCGLTDDDGVAYCYYDGTTSVKPEIKAVKGWVSGASSSIILSSSDYTVEYANNNAVYVGSDLSAGPAMTIKLNSSSNYAYVSGTGQTVYYRIYYNMASSTVSVSGVGSMTFNGSAQTPSFTVADTYVGANLDSSDYSYKWTNNTNAGTATLTLTGIGKYKGTKSIDYTIAPADIKTAATITLDPSVYSYTGSKIYLDSYITVKIGSYTVPNTNYTLSYDSNYSGALGVNGVTVTGKNNLTNSTELQFRIVNAISGYTLSGTSFTYTGATIKPTITVTDRLGTVVSSSNYTVTYYSSADYDSGSLLTNPTAVGTYYIKIVGNSTNNFSGTLGTTDSPIAYTITPKAISSCTYTIGGQTATSSSDIKYTYSGSEQKKSVTVADGATSLVEGTDYTIGYYTDSSCTTAASSIKNAGVYYIKITGLGAYSGSTYILHYTISPKIIAPTITVVDQTYTGSAVTPATTDITLSASGIDSSTIEYKIISCTNNTAIGTNTAVLVVQLTGNYTTNDNTTVSGTVYKGTVTGNFTIAPKKISECSCNLVSTSTNYDSSQLSFVYNGSIQTPKIVIKDGTKTLTAGTDYSIGYYTGSECLDNQATTGQKNVGTCYVKITGLGTYASTASNANIIASYQVTQKPLTSSDITVTASSQAYTGAAVTAALAVKDGTNAMTLGTDYAIAGYYTDQACQTASAHTDAGLVYVKVTGQGNYSGSAVTSFYIGTDINSLAGSLTVTGAPFTYDTTSHYDEINSGITVYSTGGEVVDSKYYSVKYYSDAAHTTEITASSHDLFKNAGTVYIGITGKSGYYGTFYGSCVINKRSISGMDATVLGTYTYTGKAIGLVLYDGTDLTQTEGVKLQYPATTTAAGTILTGSDYAIKVGGYTNNINAGTATVTLVGQGTNYTGTKTVNFTINQKSLNTLNSESTVNVTIPQATFTSRKQVPTVNVVYGDSSTALASGTDYTVAYYLDSSYSTLAADANLTNAGSVYVKITGKGNYKDVLTSYTGTNIYKINPRDINEASVDLAGNTYVYSAITNSSKIPTFTVKYEYATGSYYTLTSGTEFTYTPTSVSYHIGSQDLDVTGTGNFTGTKTIKYYYQGNMSNDANEITVSGIEDSYVYNATTATSGITCSNIVVSNKNDGQVISSDCYTVSYKNNKAAGTATVMISGNNAKYWTGTYTKDFKITGTISDATITIPDQVYTGSAYTGDTLKDVRVVCDGYELKYGTDYQIISIANATNAALSTSSSAPSITIKGIGDYFAGTATKAAAFSIKYDITASGLAVQDIPTQTYTGTAVEPELTVKYHKLDDTYADLTKGVDYTVKYYNNTAVGAANGTSGPYAVITATDTGLLSAGSKTIPFSIGKVDLTDGYAIKGITEGQEFSYTGAIIKPTFTVEKNGTVVDASNYTVTYTWNTTTSYPVAGSVETIKVTGKGNYLGTLTMTVNVIPRDLSTGSDAVSVVIEDQTYTGSAIEPSFDVTFTDYASKTQKLKLGTDYRIVGYFSNTDAATGDTDAPYTGGPYIQIQAISGSNCTGTRNIPFTILPKSMDKLSYSTVSDMTYTAGTDKYDPALTVKMSSTATAALVKNTDYYVEYLNDTKVGTANLTNGPYIRIFPASSNYTGEKIIPYSILAKSIKSDDVNISLQDTTNSSFDTTTWNYPYVAGTTYTPTVVMTDNSGTTDPIVLTKGTDYTVTYTDNTYTGTATVTITGTGNYSGSRTVKFTIGTLFTSAKIAVYKDNVQVTELPSVTYDGTDKTPAGITVKLISSALLLNQNASKPDYEIHYYKDSACTTEIAAGSIINAGTYYVAVCGLASAGYVGNVVLPYTIKQKSINSSDITPAAIADQTYADGNVRPSVELTDTSVNQVVPTSAYDVTYESNNAIGSAKAIVTANASGNYTGTRTIYFNIVEEDISNATVNTIPDYTYTGSAVTPDPEVYINGSRLVKGRDYTLTYGNNIKTGSKDATPWIVILGKGNYKGKKVVPFTIKADLSTATVSTVSSQLYTGKAITPKVTVSCGGNTLVEGTDYTVTYSQNTDIGDAAIIIEAKEGSYYSGSRVIKFSICNDIAQATVTQVPNSQTYTKGAITPEPVLSIGSKRLAKGTDYTVKWTNDVNVGTASIVITGSGKYAGTKTVSYKIIAKSIARCTVGAISDVNYNGKAHTPAVVVKDGSKILAKGTDYTVTYSSNKKIGTATITVTGKGNYSGTSSVKFHIVSASITGLKASSQTTTTTKISWAKASSITGYQVYTNDSRKLISQTTGTSYTLKNLKAGATYKYKVRTYTKIGSKTYYGAFKTVTFATQPKATTAKAVSKTSKTARITWSKISGATGYQVYRATSYNGSYQKVATIIKGSTVSYTNTGLTSGRTYYYKVRAYRTADGKNVYSAFSDVTSAEVR